MDKAATQAAFSINFPVGFGAGVFSWSADGKTMTFNPTNTINYGGLVMWRISAGAQDLAGNPLSEPVSRSFHVIKQGTLVLNSVAASDGYIRSDGPQVLAAFSTAHVGELGGGASVRSFLTFNLSTLPASTVRITNAALYVYQMQLKGSPVSALGGAAKLERLNYGESLDAADLNAPRFTGIGDSLDFSFGATNGWKSNGQVALAVAADFQSRVSRGNLSQFRLRFPNATSGANNQNYVSFYTGESANTDCPRNGLGTTGSSCKPYLIVIYEYP